MQQWAFLLFEKRATTSTLLGLLISSITYITYITITLLFKSLWMWGGDKKRLESSFKMWYAMNAGVCFSITLTRNARPPTYFHSYLGQTVSQETGKGRAGEHNFWFLVFTGREVCMKFVSAAFRYVPTFRRRHSYGKGRRDFEIRLVFHAFAKGPFSLMW